MSRGQKTKKGFTIIEVVLVLAIAGLIFLMVFIALPALQRSQRDTQRRNDLGQFTTALNQYQTNNRGAVPTTADQWKNFLKNYLNNSHETPDVYLDPDGYPYQISVTKKYTEGSGEPSSRKTDCDLDNSGITFDSCVSFKDSAGVKSGGLSWGDGSATTTDEYVIYVYGYAECDGETVKAAPNGRRKVAFLYKLEGAGTYCGTN